MGSWWEQQRIPYTIFLSFLIFDSLMINLFAFYLLLPFNQSTFPWPSCNLILTQQRKEIKYNTEKNPRIVPQKIKHKNIKTHLTYIECFPTLFFEGGDDGKQRIEEAKRNWREEVYKRYYGWDEGFYESDVMLGQKTPICYNNNNKCIVLI